MRPLAVNFDDTTSDGATIRGGKILVAVGLFQKADLFPIDSALVPPTDRGSDTLKIRTLGFGQQDHTDAFGGQHATGAGDHARLRDGRSSAYVGGWVGCVRRKSKQQSKLR